jgi:hypoxanthine phosphoribosyltransferase
MIVGVSRGGLIPSRILADQLDLKDLYVVKIAFYTGIGKTADRPVIKQPLSVNLEGKTVLLVDDILDTGGSMKAAMEYVESFHPKKMYTATLHIKKTSPFKPDFFAVEKSNWLIYPWEKNESRREIAEMKNK